MSYAKELHLKHRERMARMGIAQSAQKSVVSREKLVQASTPPSLSKVKEAASVVRHFSRVTEEMRDTISAHWRDPLNLIELSQLVGLSPSYTSRIGLSMGLPRRNKSRPGPRERREKKRPIEQGASA